MIKLARNGLCPCGSGKKFKKCCMADTSEPSVADFAWRKLRQLESDLALKHLLPYVRGELPKEIVELALSDLVPENLPEALDKELFFNHFFMPWFLYSWVPFEDFGLAQFDPEVTIAENYAKSHGDRLSTAEKILIVAMGQSHYSFYSVLGVEIEKSLAVKDIMLGTTHIVKERQGTHQIKRGDIVFCRILTLGEQSIFVGTAPFLIPADYGHPLIDFKEWLVKENGHRPLSPTDLRENFDLELFNFFFAIMGKIFDRPMPNLANTDGEPLQFIKAFFQLSIAPEEALRLLLPLTLSKDVEEFLEGAKRDKTGAVKKIACPWLKKGNKLHKDWENTVMGHISIEKGKLMLEVNSEERLKKGKKMLKKYLGEAICLQKTLIEAVEQKLKSSRRPPTQGPEHAALLNLPEAQEKIKAMARSHWENWLDEPVPALKGQTPREAAKTQAGRERLEALLLQYERHDLEQGDNNIFKADVPYLRAKLGLGQ